jgi:hypothetical protein
VGGRERNVSVVIQARDEASKVLDSFARNLTTIGGALATAGALAAGFGALLVKVTKAASEQETADARLAIALASVGENTEATRARLAKFIGELENLTTVSDDSIASAVGLLAQIGRLRGEGLERATKAALDLSAALGVDLQSAAQLVAKAAQGNTAALSRYGIVLDESIPKGQRFEALLKLIEDRFRGTAEAAGKTLSAALQRIQNDWSNLLEATGKAVVENESFRALLEAVSKVLQGVTRWVEEHNGALGDLITLLSRGALAMAKMTAQVTAFELRMISGAVAIGQVGVALASMASDAPALVKKAFGFTDQDEIDLAKWAGEWSGRLATISGLFLSLAGAGDDAAARLQEIMDQLEKGGGKPRKVADEIGNIGTTAGEATRQLSFLNQVLKELGVETLVELEKTAIAVDFALNALMKDLETGKISPEQFDAILASLTEITRTLPQWSEDLSAAIPHVEYIRDRWAEVGEVIDTQVKNSVLEFSDAMIDAALGAQISWEQFFKWLLAQLVKAIARAVLLDFVLQGFGLGFGARAAGPPGISIGGGVYAAQHGGEVRGGIPGLDSVLAMLTPGEIILPERLASDFQTFAATVREGSTQPGAGPGRGDTFQLLAKIEPRRDRQAEAIELIDEINRLVESRGYRLSSSRVVT